MQYRNLGKSPLQVSALCLGTMMFEIRPTGPKRRISSRMRMSMV